LFSAGISMKDIYIADLAGFEEPASSKGAFGNWATRASPKISTGGTSSKLAEAHRVSTIACR
jgi:hypothetical protein